MLQSRSPDTELERAVREVKAAKNLEERRACERKYFNRVKNSQVANEDGMYLIDIEWVRHWILFIKGKSDTVLGRIDNRRLQRLYFQDKQKIEPQVHFYFITEPLWNFIFKVYGGGPTIVKSKDLN